MKKKTKATQKKDQRKIPDLFRAVWREDKGSTYFGHLISDNGDNLVCFASHDGEESIFKERVLKKSEFSFSKIDTDDFALWTRRALRKMSNDVSEAKMCFEATDHDFSYAQMKFKQIVGVQ